MEEKSTGFPDGLDAWMNEKMKQIKMHPGFRLYNVVVGATIYCLGENGKV